jgi:uncharacterized membrane protein
MVKMENVVIRGCVGMVLASLIAGSSFRRNSVNLVWCFCWVLGNDSNHYASYRFRALLLVFFFTSSMLTKRGTEKKREIDAHYKGGQWD